MDNCPGGLGTNRKIRVFLKLFKNSTASRHNFVDAFIASCLVSIRLNNSQRKVLPFLLSLFLVTCGRAKSRDNIDIIKKHQIDKIVNICIWQSFSLLLPKCSETDHLPQFLSD